MRNTENEQSTDRGRNHDYDRDPGYQAGHRDAGYRDASYRDANYHDERHIAPNYDSHYDEGEDHVGFVNIIDMDIPFFQLVWLIFKIFLAAIVAASMIALLAMLLSWILSLPVVQDILPGDTSWLNDLINPGNS